MALGPGGRIALAGGAYNSLTQERDLTLAVYDPTGRLDPGFGDGGRVVIDFGTQWGHGPSSQDEAYAVAFTPDGALLVAGTTTAPRGDGKLALARFDRTGRLDPEFGDGGVAILGLRGRVRALALQPDGRILIGGSGVPYDDREAPGWPDFHDESGFTLARFRADGTPDPGFGEAGLIRVGHSPYGEVEGLALQPDGTVLAVTHSRDDGATGVLYGTVLVVARGKIWSRGLQMDRGSLVLFRHRSP